MRRGRKSTTMLRRVFALVLALVMVLAFSATALADGTTLDANGEQGAFDSSKGETPDPIENKTLILEKEIIAYNPATTTISAPDITYRYTIAPDTVATGVQVTDKNNVTNPVYAGVAPEGGFSDVDVIFTAGTDSFNASPEGESNVKDIAINFGGVVFERPGIYRYTVTESVVGGDCEDSGITAGDGSSVRFVDVYVMQANGYTNGESASDWAIYGFTCFYNDESIQETDKTTVAVKTTGFVDGTNSTSGDKYYTYNLTLSKTVVGDAYSASHNLFPFSVAFANEDVTKNIDIIGLDEATEDLTGDIDFAIGILSETNGVVNIRSGASITYYGIPCGTSVTVYETNPVAGVTYKVETTVDGTAAEEDDDDALAKDETSVQVTIETEKDDPDEVVEHTVAITNTFVAISPTGVILRYAPYMLILAGGILMLVLGTKLLRRSKREEE